MQATIAGDAPPGSRAVLKCKVQDGPWLRMCSLREGGTECCGLDLIFDEYTEFVVEGSAGLHLTGRWTEASCLSDLALTDPWLVLQSLHPACSAGQAALPVLPSASCAGAGSLFTAAGAAFAALPASSGLKRPLLLTICCCDRWLERLAFAGGHTLATQPLPLHAPESSAFSRLCTALHALGGCDWQQTPPLATAAGYMMPEYGAQQDEDDYEEDPDFSEEDLMLGGEPDETTLRRMLHGPPQQQNLALQYMEQRLNGGKCLLFSLDHAGLRQRGGVGPSDHQEVTLRCTHQRLG